MADPGADTSSNRERTRQFLTFRLDRRLYALPAEAVAEVIRVPAVARLPQGPHSLLGIANLRGAVLPVASASALLGEQQTPMDAHSRTIVLTGAAPVGVAVDSVDALVSIDPQKIETRQTELAAHPGERLQGAFQVSGDQVAKILDIHVLLAAAFVQRARPQRQVQTAAGVKAQADDTFADRLKLVTFEVADQEFGLALDVVQEIIPAPTSLAAMPHSEKLVLGVTSYRGGLLPLLSLRGLLGFALGCDAQQKVIVTKVGGALVGLVADRMRSVLPADPALIDQTPQVLAARTGGETRIKAIYRGDGGRRLISILTPEQLFKDDVMERLGKNVEAVAEPLKSDDQGLRTSQFLIFRLGTDEFGLPIDVVDEVSQVPEQITRVPNTPGFLEGVVNLRGEVLPVVDQRRRFDMPELTDKARRRLIVVRTAKHRAGLIVDSVSEVLRSAIDAIEPAPDLTGEATRLVNGVVNLETSARIVLLLDPNELLSRTESRMLDAFQSDGQQADL